MSLRYGDKHVHGTTGLILENVAFDTLRHPSMSEAFKTAMKDAGVLTPDGGIGDGSLLDTDNNPMFTFPVIGNEYLSAIYNKVGRVWVHNKLATNKLSILKKTGSPWGGFTEEIHVNPGEAKDYDSTSQNLLAQEIPDVKVAYHKESTPGQFTTTITYAIFRKAFSSPAGFSELVDTIISRNYNGNTQREFNMTRAILGSAISLNKIVKIPIADPTASESNARAFTAKIRELSGNFEEPSTKYNAYLQYPDADQTRARVSWCYKPEQVIVTTNELEAFLDVNVLSYAYNMNKSEFAQRVLTISEFLDADGLPIVTPYAILMDQNFINFDTREEINTEFYNPQNLTTSFFLTVFQSLTLSPFANAVALVPQT